MINHPRPDNDNERVASLHRMVQMDTPAEARFDRLTRLAGQLFKAPVSMVTFIEEDRQWFKSARGHMIGETPRVESFCQYTICKNEPLIVENALADERFFDLPAVFDLGIRFYAGVPVRNPDGHAVGTLCVLDFDERSKDEIDSIGLVDLGRCVETELRLQSFQEKERELLARMSELERKASVDPVTRCWNEETGVRLAGDFVKECPPDPQSGVAFLLLTLKNLAEFNRSAGSQVGDFYLREAADRLRRFLPEGTVLCRSARATFLAIVPNVEIRSAEESLEEDVQRACEGPFHVAGNTVEMELYGGFVLSGRSPQPLEHVLDRAAKTCSKTASEARRRVRLSI